MICTQCSVAIALPSAPAKRFAGRPTASGNLAVGWFYSLDADRVGPGPAEKELLRVDGLCELAVTDIGPGIESQHKTIGGQRERVRDTLLFPLGVDRSLMGFSRLPTLVRSKDVA